MASAHAGDAQAEAPLSHVVADSQRDLRALGAGAPGGRTSQPRLPPPTLLRTAEEAPVHGESGV
jgi:hypothetical protein